MGPTTNRSAKRGADTLEYAMLAAIFCLGICIAAFLLRDQVADIFNGIRNNLETVSAGGAANSGGGSATPDEPSTPEPTPGLPAEDADPASWDLAQQKAVATDLERNGTSSKYYEKAMAAVNADTRWTMPLTDGTTLAYRIVGVLHDDLADGTGKAGLTFQATHALPKAYRMNATDTNKGGWEKSELRQNMNSGEIWGLFGSDFQSFVVAVDKLTQNVGGDERWIADGTQPSGGHGSAEAKFYKVSPTSDHLFLLSEIEMLSNSGIRSTYPYYKQEGYQYEWYSNSALESGPDMAFWVRTVNCSDPRMFHIFKNGGKTEGVADPSGLRGVVPAWCF